MIKKILSLSLFFLFLAGCSHCLLMRSEYFDVTGKSLTAKPEGTEIEIYTVKPDKPYQEIGTVKAIAQHGMSRKALDSEMKRRAAAAGADAIINVQYGEDTTNNLVLCGKLLSTTRNSIAVGTAIIFKSPVPAPVEQQPAQTKTK